MSDKKSFKKLALMANYKKYNKAKEVCPKINAVAAKIKRTKATTGKIVEFTSQEAKEFILMLFPELKKDKDYLTGLNNIIEKYGPLCKEYNDIFDLKARSYTSLVDLRTGGHFRAPSSAFPSGTSE